MCSCFGTWELRANPTTHTVRTNKTSSKVKEDSWEGAQVYSWCAGLNTPVTTVRNGVCDSCFPLQQRKVMSHTNLGRSLWGLLKICLKLSCLQGSSWDKWLIIEIQFNTFTIRSVRDGIPSVLWTWCDPLLLECFLPIGWSGRCVWRGVVEVGVGTPADLKSCAVAVDLSWGLGSKIRAVRNRGL